ncbi:MAG: hypothetical protein JST69_00555 [Bacteroidetes bacterium]|nr:hypothetical protein [Bacteroidota bacterium]
MRFLLILLAICLLASCTTEFQCTSYGNTNNITTHGKKSQSKYARHNKHRLLF